MLYSFVVNKKIAVLILVIGAVGLGIWAVFFNKPKNTYTSPVSIETKKVIKPSETFTQYSDPSGFTFSYPDNLSIKKNDTDDSTYADLVLSSSEVSGSLSLRVVDSKYKTLDDWVNLNKKAAKDAPKEVFLGKLKGLELTTADRLYFGALDQGILFTIEMPAIEQDFWMKVYSKVLADFSFTPPVAAGDTSSGDVSLEEEQVVE